MGLEKATQAAPPLWRRLVYGRNPKVTCVRAICLALLTVGIFQYVLIPVRISGISMEPTYHDKGINLINHYAYRWGAPARGDVVAVQTSGRHIMYLKRIVGLPGETIAIKNGIVSINEKPLEEPYLIGRQAWNLPLQKIPADKYYIIGDNRRMPIEQQDFGATEGKRILGKVIW